MGSGTTGSGATGGGSMSGTTGSGPTSSTQTAQQPGSFDVTHYKTKTECLNAATTAKADIKLCDGVKAE